MLVIPLYQSNVATFLSTGNQASYNTFMVKAEINEYDNDPACRKDPDDPVLAIKATA